MHLCANASRAFGLCVEFVFVNERLAEFETFVVVN